MNNDQKIRRYELENRRETLTPAERVLLAAYNDLREGEDSGKDLAKSIEAVKQAEEAVSNEAKGKTKDRKGRDVTQAADVTGAENVTRVQKNQSELV